MMNAAVIIVVLTTLLIHCGHCQQRVTFSALQDAPKKLHSRFISIRQTCTREEFQSLIRAFPPKCAELNPNQSFENQNTTILCQQQCRGPMLAIVTRCGNSQDVNTLMRLCPGNNAGTHNAGSSAEAPTFFKALFLLTSTVMAMLLL